MPDWYELASEQARDEHDPADFDGRAWHELTDTEQSELILEYVLAKGDVR